VNKPRNWLPIVVITAALAIAIGAALWWIALRPAPISYVTAPVTRGDVATTITASGVINPVITVQVGTYVSGTIVSLTCDFNTRVHKGQLCAKIDPAPYQIIVDEDAADLANAKAQIVKDQANVVYTKLASGRAALLLSEDSGSRDAADTTLDAYKQAVALVGVDAAVIQQRAAILKAAQINLNYTNIVSPVDGTVVTRDITAGQTVAASLQTPTLFSSRPISPRCRSTPASASRTSQAPGKARPPASRWMRSRTRRSGAASPRSDSRRSACRMSSPTTW